MGEVWTCGRPFWRLGLADGFRRCATLMQVDRGSATKRDSKTGIVTSSSSVELRKASPIQKKPLEEVGMGSSAANLRLAAINVLLTNSKWRQMAVDTCYKLSPQFIPAFART